MQNNLECMQTRGHKQYHLSNHLGNVLVTIQDRKEALAFGTPVIGAFADQYHPYIVTATDYYAFGGSMEGQSIDAQNAVAALRANIKNGINGIATAPNPGSSHGFPGIQNAGFIANQFNQIFTATSVGGTNPANPPIDFAPAIADINNGTTGVANFGTIAQNTSRILIITNGTAASNQNAINIVGTPAVAAVSPSAANPAGIPAVPATGLHLTYPNMQFGISSAPNQGLNNDQVDIIANPTQNFVTFGNSANTWGYNLTLVQDFSNGNGVNRPMLLREPLSIETPIDPSTLP